MKTAKSKKSKKSKKSVPKSSSQGPRIKVPSMSAKLVLSFEESKDGKRGSVAKNESGDKFVIFDGKWMLLEKYKQKYPGKKTKERKEKEEKKKTSMKEKEEKKKKTMQEKKEKQKKTAKQKKENEKEKQKVKTMRKDAKLLEKKLKTAKAKHKKEFGEDL